MGYEAGFARAMNRGIRESIGRARHVLQRRSLPDPDVSRRDRPRSSTAHPAPARRSASSSATTSPPTALPDVIDTAGLVLTRQRRFMPRGEGRTRRGPVRRGRSRSSQSTEPRRSCAGRRSRRSASTANTSTRTSSRTRRTTTSRGACASPAGSAGTCRPRVAYHGRTTRGLGSSGYLSAIRSFHRTELREVPARAGQRA